MVVEGRNVEARKRKSAKSGSSGKREQKRPRREENFPESADEDERLIRLLTGKDDEQISKKEHTGEASPSDDDDSSESSDASRDDAGTTGENENETNQDLGAVADTGSTSDAHNLDWGRALSAAHAKKINITVLLENANLETVKQSGRSGGFVLLNCEDHRHILKKTGRDANDARPDITHQCLLALMDSPLNKAGKLKVYVRTAKNVLIEVHPQTRIPRTIRRFSGLMTELLEKFKVRGTTGSVPLLKVIRNPIVSHLPVGTRKIVCTYNTDNIVDMREHASRMAALAIPKTVEKRSGLATEEDIDEKGEIVNVLYVIGAMAHGKISEDWADEEICVSEYPLSAANVCSRLTYTYECLLGIL